jgi:hypothetical protein
VTVARTMTNQPQQDPSQAPNGSWGAGFLGVLLILVGLTLLLPGLCTMALVISETGSLIALAFLAISAVGLWLVVIGLRMAYGQ